MILLAIKVVLLFTYTSSDNFTLLFYNLLSFVYRTVYKQDTPERILEYIKPAWPLLTDWYILSTPGDNYVYYIANETNCKPWGTPYVNIYNQRPVLY